MKLRHDVGIRNLAWSTDFPHHGCDWPYSRKVVDEMMVGVPQPERYQMLAGNMVRIYGLPQSLKRCASGPAYCFSNFAESSSTMSFETRLNIVFQAPIE